MTHPELTPYPRIPAPSQGDAAGPGVCVPALGVDLVHIPGVAEQLAHPGTAFLEVLSPVERRLMHQRTPARRAEFVAGRYAAKEAVVKAWEQALVGQPPVLGVEELRYAEISVEHDPWGRLIVRLAGCVAERFAASCPGCRLQVSLSHDGEYAVAHALLVRA
ncbi:holo-ACP synthase [Corynebacterium sp. 13CS0277]|uniref:holo-ACP synthase AcpS n=1 Tax=Corynebacterium sp. 13CS0277 TaxID=2071994 RepID=UPI000D0421ED|nr:holo-ACP synthase [Corynebacterium sp. 13CS0277]PRQ10831.1 holo-ACP synthase [Corynebacterium sp. 13CS0277]